MGGARGIRLLTIEITEPFPASGERSSLDLPSLESVGSLNISSSSSLSSVTADVLVEVAGNLTIRDTARCRDDVDALAAQLVSLDGIYTASNNTGVCQ